MLKQILSAAPLTVLAVLLLPAEVDAYGAAHVGYTHVGPNGAYHVGKTEAVGPGGAYAGGHATAVGAGGAYGGAYHYGAVGTGGAYQYGGAAVGGAYHYGGTAYAPSYYGAAGYGYIR